MIKASARKRAKAARERAETPITRVAVACSELLPVRGRPSPGCGSMIRSIGCP
jgi:hypothetical protein